MKPGRTTHQDDPMPGSRAAMIIERAPLPIVEVQGSAHTVSHVNSAFCRLLGKSQEDLMGKSFADIVHGGNKCMPILDRVYQTGEAATVAQADDSDSASWLYAMWPALDANEQPEAVLIQLAKTANLRQDTAAVNEALLIAGLHQHELAEAAEKLNAQLQAEIVERKETEAKFRASEVEAKRALDYAEATLRTTPIPFLVLRADLRVDTASEAFYKAFKVAPAATEDRLIYEVGNGQWNIPRLRELLEQIIPQKNVFNGFEVTHKFAAIGTRTMLLNARRMDNAEGVPERILLAIEDITDRKQASQYARSLIEASLDPLVTISAEGKITDVNEGSVKVTGVARENLIGTDFSDYFTEPEKAREGYLQVFAKSFVTDYPLTIRHRDGRLTDVLYNASIYKDVSGNVLGVFAAARDITDRKQAEEALRESEVETKRARDYAEATLRTAPIPLLVLRADLRVNTANEAFYKNFRVAPAETEGTLIYNLGNRQWNIPRLRELLEEILPKNNFFNNFEITHDFETIGRRTMLLNARRMENDAGQPLQIVLAIEDITERKHAEEALQVAMVEIERSSRAKDDFLASLSHELRTPLTPVLMMATALENDPALTSAVRDQLSMMRRNIELEARLIDDLLDLTRISRGKLVIDRQPVDVHQLLDHTAEIVLSDRLGKEVRIVFTHAAARHHALADSTRLQQVFWNLIKNAVKFTPPGGKITVATGNDAAGRIVISVVDTGLGISEEALPHIFNAFEQGDVSGQHRYGGLGLGLAISKAIMEAHGGTIVAESPGPGRGATFTVALDSTEAPAAASPCHDTPAGPSRALRLLVVEDHETTRNVLEHLLTNRGHHVTTAASIGEALAAFAAHHFDGIISDLGLPDGSGLDLMEQIQRQRPIPAIALSGYGMEEDLRLTKEAGFFAHLVKPVNLDQLRQLIDQITPSPL